MKTKSSLLLAISLAMFAGAAEHTHWVATWGASPAPQLPADQMRAAKLEFDKQTIRQIVRVSIGGASVRIRLSNAYGKREVELGAVHVAVRSEGSGIVAGSDRVVTFSGRSSIVIPPDAAVLSDAVKLEVPAGRDLAVSIFMPKAATGGGIHYAAQQTAYIGSGDQTAAGQISGADTIASWVFLNGVDVLASQAAGTVVTFGDSITDGARSTVDANKRWPNTLASRLTAQPGGKKLGVVDAGIGGNRIWHDGVANVRFGVNGLARFERDVLSQPGVQYVVLLEGINDLGHAGSSAPESETVTAEDIIAGLTQMIERAHEKGLKVFVGTLTPFDGFPSRGYYTREKETKRQAVNEWVRNNKIADAFIDFDKAIRDPKAPGKINAPFDSGDHLHPGDTGYTAMGEAVDLKLFR